MAQLLGSLAKWAIPVGLAVGGAQSAMYDGNVYFIKNFAEKKKKKLTIYASPGWLQSCHF